MKILYPDIETLSARKLEAYQLKQLNNILEHAKHTPYYKDRFPQKINSLGDFSKLPLLSKDDLRKAFPFGLLAVSKDKLIRVSASSGTTGIPTISYCTKNDLSFLTQNEALHFSHAGLSNKDIIQCMVSIGLFTAGWGCYYGASEIGATIIPSGVGNTKRQINLLKSLKANYTYSTPGYLQYLISTIKHDDWKCLSLKTAITGGEILTKNFQEFAKKKYGIEIYNFYGMTEFATHIASECCIHDGLHVNEDLFYVEIINPDTGEPLPDGEVGELVVTDLKREAMPLIRYRTRDITRILPGKCPCGRTHRRIETITKRIDDMMIINGVNVFPSQIEECIYAYLTTATNYVIHVSEKNGLKHLCIDIELSSDMLRNKNKLRRLEQQLTSTLRSYITITPKLNFIKQGSLPEIEGKIKRVVFDEIS